MKNKVLDILRHLLANQCNKTGTLFLLPTGSSSELISSLEYCPGKNILSASTNAGYVYMWKYPPGRRPGEEDWKALPRVHIGG